MTRKKNNLILIIPAFSFVGAAIGVQTQSIIKQLIVGLIVGILVYLFLKKRNNRIKDNK